MSPILAPSPFVRATVTNFFFALAMNGFVLLPLYVQQLGGGAVEIGIVMGLYSAVGIVCQPLIGPWVDVIGRRPFMLAGVVLNLVSSLLAVLPGGVPLLALVRAVQGIAFSMFFVASFSYVIDIIPPARRGWALGIYGVSGFVSTAVAPLFGEWIIRTLGFRALFALSAVLGLVTAALVWPVREAARHSTLPARLAPGAMQAAVEDLLHLHMFVTMFFGLGSGTIFAFLPTFAEDLGVRTLSLFYTAYALAAIAVRIAGGRLIDTRGRRAVIVPSMFVQAASTGLLAALGALVIRNSATPVLPSLFVAGLLSGGAHGFLYPGLAALVTDHTPAERRAAVVGLFSAMFLTGQAAGAFAFGYVAHAAGYEAMWAALTLLLALGGVLSMRLAR
ncbi:MAG: MFS transporter [Candidatus Rokuibacteriota bacterium]|nr:MAG: MFS transporter [Candidatus Rokubacteria bacterium]